MPIEKRTIIQVVLTMAPQDDRQLRLPTIAGAPIADNQNSSTAGGRGPAIMHAPQKNVEVSARLTLARFPRREARSERER